MELWHIVESKKPRRKGEVFLKRGDVFVAKIYKDGDDPMGLARYLAKNLNAAHTRKVSEEKSIL